MSRSRFATLMSMLVLVVTACGGGGATTRPPGTSAAAGSSAPAATAASQAPSGSAATGGQLLIWADDKRAAALKPLADRFGTEQGVTVKVEAISKDLIANFKTASGAGTGPDIVIWAHDVLGDLVANGYVEPIQLSNAADFEPLAIKGMTFDGQLYGVPYNVENIALFRNTDLVPNAPKTMEELVTTGKQLVTDGKTSEILSLQVGQAGDAYHIFPLFVSGGGGLFGATAAGDPDPNQVLVDSPGSIAAGEKIKALGETGAKALKTSIDGSNAIPLFFNKKAPFLISGPWAVADIVKAGIKYDISPIPQFTGGAPAGPFIGVNGFYVASKGKNKAIAQEFATNFATTLDVQLAFYAAEPRPPALLAAFQKASTDNPDVAKFQAARAGGTILPAIPAMGKVWGPFGNAESAIVKGGDVKAILDAAAKAIRDAIKAG
jgi:arabinogalactan oligomer/maltooligosaccharide transport system substrate-binding protein